VWQVVAMLLEVACSVHPGVSSCQPHAMHQANGDSVRVSNHNAGSVAPQRLLLCAPGGAHNWSSRDAAQPDSHRSRI